MVFLMSIKFWFCAFVLYCAMALPINIPRSAKFGILNGFVLSVLLGERTLVLVVIFALVCWCFLKAVRTLADKGHSVLKNWLMLSALIALTVSFYLHKATFIAQDASSSLPAGFPWISAPFIFQRLVAVSYSYIFLRSLDLFLNCGFYGRRLLDPVSLLGYLAPFHMLPSGPIAPYRDYLEMNNEPEKPRDFGAFLGGLNLLATGLVYKFVFGNLLYRFVTDASNVIVIPHDFLSSVLLLTYLYFDFCGISMVALGLGNLLGVPTPVNFNKPYLSSSVTDFWRRWHMSLGNFVLRNIFIPSQIYLGRSFGKKFTVLASTLAAMTTFAFVGLWHKITASFFVWGLFMGLILGVEKIVQTYWMKLTVPKNRLIKATVCIAGPFYTISIIALSLLLVWKDLILF